MDIEKEFKKEEYKIELKLVALATIEGMLIYFIAINIIFIFQYIIGIRPPFLMFFIILQVILNLVIIIAGIISYYLYK